MHFLFILATSLLLAWQLPAGAQREIAVLARTVGEIRNGLRAAWLQHSGWEKRARRWGCSFPRWAIFHALAEEHERLSWGEEFGGGAEGGTWAGQRRSRAAQLYAMALASPTLANMSPAAFSAAFNRSAAAIRRLSLPPQAKSRRDSGAPLFSDAAAAAAAAELDRMWLIGSPERALAFVRVCARAICGWVAGFVCVCV